MALSDKRRLEGRGGAWLGIVLVGAIAAAAVLAPSPPAETVPEAPEYTEIEIPPYDDTREQWGTHPDLRVMGIVKEQSSDVLCSEERIDRMDAFVVGHGVGELFVDAESWDATPSGTKAGIASFFSKCRHNGESLDVLAGPGGVLLAVYDPDGGLSLRGH